jgi:hypothetical protein
MVTRPVLEPRSARFNTRKANWGKLTSYTELHLNEIYESSVNRHGESLTNLLRAATEVAVPRSKTGNHQIGWQPWWTDELTKLKKTLERSRRLGQRTGEPDVYRGHRNLATIRKAKMAAWRKLAGDLNTNPWGKAIRWAKRKGPATCTVLGTLKKPDGTHTGSIEETAKQLLTAFVPEETTNQEIMYHCPVCEMKESLSSQEIKYSLWRIKPDKAQGLDGLNGRILRKAWPILSTTTTRLYNSVLRECQFPLIWRNANIIVIPKGGNKDPATTSAYRSISLLPVLGKALETFIIKKIKNETRLSEIGEQHGFFQGKSTITAINTLYSWINETNSRHVIGTFLDITGAFDNVSWGPLMKQLERIGASLRTLRIVESYLTNRRAHLTLEGRTYQKKLERGCPQGSQLGPTLWKIAMSELLAMPNEENVKVIAYADDIVILVGATRHGTAVKRTEMHIDKVIKWASTYKLSFSQTKTQVLSSKEGVKPGYQIRFGTG